MRFSATMRYHEHGVTPSCVDAQIVPLQTQIVYLLVMAIVPSTVATQENGGEVFFANRAVPVKSSALIPTRFVVRSTTTTGTSSLPTRMIPLPLVALN